MSYTNMEKQVEKQMYNFKKYCDQDRWLSYWRQIDEILKLNPENILEIGIGDKVLASYLSNNTTIKYSSLDIAEDLSPDFIGSVDDIKLNDNFFDLVCAFEVLEHLPFKKFAVALKEMSRVSKKYIVISLPHWGRHFSIEIKLPYFKKIRWQIKFSLFPIKHIFNGQHYWEIGKKDYEIKKIKKIIMDNGFNIINDYIAFESPYHHFFILVK